MYYIGIDLGGTKIAVGLVSEDGVIITKKSVPTLNHRMPAEIIKDMVDTCFLVIDESGVSISDIASIGIGSPGFVYPPDGVLVYANNLKFDNTCVRSEIQKSLDLPVYVENDANCAALGESVAGAAKGAINSVTVTLGTGVGSGIIINKMIYSGTFFGAAEIGHHCIMVDGEVCTCGRHGCWEAYASATALIRDAKRAVLENTDSLILKLANNDSQAINAKMVFDAADENDETAVCLVDNYIKYISEGITNLINIFQPEILVIGGGVSSRGERLLKPIIQYVEKTVYGGALKTDIVMAKLGNDAGIIGAAMLGKAN